MNPFKKAARLAMMESVRPKFLSLFENTVNEMVKENPFKPTDCIVYELARAAARKMGVSEDLVKKETLHNHWKSAEFTHTISTPMPPPPKKGMPQDPPVITTTVFKVIAKSALIDLTYLKINEDNTNIGSDVSLSLLQRPTPDPSKNNDGSSSSSPPENTGGKGKGGKGKGKGKK